MSEVSIAQIDTLKPYTKNGLELVINTKTGECFASISATARMIDKEPSVVLRYANKQLHSVAWQQLLSAEIPTAAGLRSVALLNENQILEVVAKYKPDLLMQCVKAGLRIFLHGLAGYKYKAVQSTEWKEARLGGIPVRNDETDTIQVFVEYARSQGSKSADKYYMNLTRMMNDTLFETFEKHKNLREVMDVLHLGLAAVGDRIIKNALIDGMKENMPYKEIFQLAKQRVVSLAKINGKLAIKAASQGALTQAK